MSLLLLWIFRSSCRKMSSTLAELNFFFFSVLFWLFRFLFVRHFLRAIVRINHQLPTKLPASWWMLLRPQFLLVAPSSRMYSRSDLFAELLALFSRIECDCSQPYLSRDLFFFSLIAATKMLCTTETFVITSIITHRTLFYLSHCKLFSHTFPAFHLYYCCFTRCEIHEIFYVSFL